MKNINLALLKFKNHNKMYILRHLLVLFIFSFVYRTIALKYGTETDKKNFRNYNDSLPYFTCITQFGIGYGDITPESTILRYSCMFHLILIFILIVV